MRPDDPQAFDQPDAAYAPSDVVLRLNRQMTDSRPPPTRLHWGHVHCKQETTMTQRSRSMKRAISGVAPFAAGVLIGLSVVTPVFAATLDAEDVQPYVLLGSLVVLLVGLILKATAVRASTRASAPSEDRPDLRRRDTYSTIDIAMPAHATH